jgi:hypothetical protein
MTRLGRRGVPLASSQARLWFLHQLRPDTTEYNLQLAVRLRGTVDVTALQDVLNVIVARHEPLRTVITSDGQPLQYVLPYFVLPLDRTPAPPGGSDDERARAVANDELSVVFDLAAAPAVRARLAQIGPDDHVLAITMHHIVFDGWSVGLFTHELATGYHARVTGRPVHLPPLPISFTDYAWWQRESLNDRRAGLLEFWRAELDGADDLQLPADRPGHGVGAGLRIVRREVAAETARGLRELAQSTGTTTFAVALAAYFAVLHRYSAQTDFVVGTPVAGRGELELEPLLGCLLNTVCVRARIRPAQSFRALVADTSTALAGTLAHQDLPFDELVHELRPSRGNDRNPLFSAFCSGLDAGAPAFGLSGLDASLIVPDQQLARFDLNATFAIGAEQPAVQVEFSDALFDEAIATRFTDHLMVTMDWAAVAPDRPVDQLPMLVAAERQDILALLNGVA